MQDFTELIVAITTLVTIVYKIIVFVSNKQK